MYDITAAQCTIAHIILQTIIIIIVAFIQLISKDECFHKFIPNIPINSIIRMHTQIFSLFEVFIMHIPD